MISATCFTGIWSVSRRGKSTGQATPKELGRQAGVTASHIRAVVPLSY